MVTVRLVDSQKARIHLDEIQGKQDVILFEGKEAEKVLMSLRETK